ncbi:MAG: putative quinol monooxygenase [Pseudomonadota bacterium]|nr:putative quinol monooxygenase [Pseudomonadota bacterium]
MYVITVDFEIDPARIEEFLPLMKANAASSVSDEPGCHLFEVCQDPEAPHRIFLYELYDDRAAFEAHLASTHFKAFDAATADMLLAKSVRAFARLQ